MITKNINGNLTLKQKLAVVLTLAIPAMIENILQTAVGFVDTLFVAKIGLVEVTAVGIANAVLAVYLCCIYGNKRWNVVVNSTTYWCK